MSGAVNASIPLQVNPSAPPAGPNLGNVFSLADMAQQIQARQQATQSQNALKQILGQPGAIDPQTGQPSANALAAVMRVDPNTGMKLQQNALAMQTHRAQLDEHLAKRQGALDDLFEPVRVDSYTAYQEAKKAGMSDEAARAQAQKVYSEGVNGVVQGGHLSADEQKLVNPQFDPQRVFMRSPTLQSAAAKQATVEHQDEELGIQRDRLAIERQRLTEPKPPVPGSVAANRAAIADDVANDPEFSGKSRGQQAAEVESRLKIAQGTLDSPEQQKETAQAIASYQLPPLSSFALSRPGGRAVMAQVTALNPDYQATEYNNYNRGIAAFGSGKQGDTVRYINNAVQHIDVIEEAGRALQNGDQRSFNEVAQRIAREFGTSAPTTFDGLKQIVGTEIERAATGGVGAAVDRNRLMESMDRANSPKQLNDVMRDFRKLFRGQANSLKNQYEQITPDTPAFRTGKFAFDNKLLPETKHALGWGADAEGKASSGASNPRAATEPLPPAAPSKSVSELSREQVAAQVKAAKSGDVIRFKKPGDPKIYSYTVP